MLWKSVRKPQDDVDAAASTPAAEPSEVAAENLEEISEIFQETDDTTPLYALAPSNAVLELQHLAEQVAQAQIEPPSEPSAIEIPTEIRTVLEVLTSIDELTVSEIATLLHCSKEKAYEVMLTMHDRGWGKLTNKEGEYAITATVKSIEELLRSWTCANCHRSIHPQQVVFGTCPYCGSNALWAP